MPNELVERDKPWFEQRLPLARTASVSGLASFPGALAMLNSPVVHSPLVTVADEDGRTTWMRLQTICSGSAVL